MRRPRRPRRGAALVEFIVALPSLLTAFFCFMQMGEAYTATLVMRHATTIVSRYASVSYPTRLIPDKEDRQGESGTNPPWPEVARRGLGYWGDVVHVKSAEVRFDDETDTSGDISTKVEYEYVCRVPVARYIVCKNGNLSKTVQLRSPLHGARYRIEGAET